MELIDKSLLIIQNWVSEFVSVQNGLQLAIVFGCALLALYSHSRWQALIIKLLGPLEKLRGFKAFIAGSDRAIFPLSMLLYIVIFRFLFLQFNFNAVILDIFTPLLLSLAAIRITVYILESGFTPSPTIRAWESIISYGIWTIVALHLIGWLDDITSALDAIGFNTGDKYFSVLSMIKLLFVIVLFMLLAHWLSVLIEKRTKSSLYLSSSMSVGLAKVSKFTLYALAVLFSLQSVGIDVTTFALLGGAIGVGIGFGLQKIFSNFISGFILLFDRSISPGDVISVGERFGTVEALHARYIVVRDRDGVETLIPNENLITSEVTNWSYTDKTVRVKLPVQISYNNDPEVAMALLLKACEEEERVLKMPEAFARLTSFGDDGINLELRIWLDDPEMGVGNIRSDLYVKIWKLFKENNIKIPFPQRDVRIISTTDEIALKN